MPSSTRTRRTAAMLLLAAALALALPSPAAGAPVAGTAAVCATADRLTASGDPGAAIATITDLREATPAASGSTPACAAEYASAVQRQADAATLAGWAKRLDGGGLGTFVPKPVPPVCGSSPALAPGVGPTSEATSALVRSAVQAALVCDGSNATALALQEELGTSAAQVAESDVDRLPGGLGRPGARAGRRRPGVDRDRARRGPAPAGSPRQPGRRPARDRAQPAGALPGRRAGGPGAELRVGRRGCRRGWVSASTPPGRARAPTSGSWPSWRRSPCCSRWAGDGPPGPTPPWLSPAPSWPWSPPSAWWPRSACCPPSRSRGARPGWIPTWPRRPCSGSAQPSSSPWPGAPALG